MQFTSELKKEWIAALRSGKYKQGRGSLYDDINNTYCCLGVLGVCAQLPLETLSHRGYLREFGKEYHLLCCSTQSLLATRNDVGHSFEAIADYIEKNIKAIDDEQV